MGSDSGQLRRLPRVDALLEHPAVRDAAQGAPRALAREAVQAAVDEARKALLAGDGPDLRPDSIAQRAAVLLAATRQSSLRRAVNAAGIVLHTGLGRAPLPEASRLALADVAGGYSNLQSDTESGQRTQREVHVLGLLKRLTGAEAALVVNNNAAATVLVLNALAAGREVLLSRGEMIEIGGAFRIPDIMALAGCALVEVGCTNRTHLRDYETAITDSTALLLSVHQSNYRIEGFASQVPIGALAELAKARGLHCAHDLGSGALVDMERFGLPHEPTVAESVAACADCAFFSGDKLVGGPQCGIIVGKASLLERMRKNPYYRAFRVGKLTLAALEAALRLFLDPDSLPQKHPVIAMLACLASALRDKAESLARRLREASNGAAKAEVAEDVSQVGGGSLAGHALPTFVVTLTMHAMGAEELARRLRRRPVPVFARVRGGAVLLDARTILPGEEAVIADAVAAIAAEAAKGAP